MLPLDSEPALNELLLRKEEEWRALQAHRSQLQEAALQDTRRQLEEAQGKLRCLQEDFVYNLQVLEERDLELERYDAAFARAREWEEARRAEVSELKIEAAKLRQALAREARKVEELQQQQQLVWQEHRLELERVHSDKNGEIDHHREQYENLKCRLERKLEELDGELALQRQELLLEFELKMQKREHEFRLQTDNMSNTALSQELKVKLLHKELEALKEAGAKAAESLQRAEATNAELERKLRSRAAELRDLEAMNCARVKDLEDKLHSVQLTRKKEEETFKRKHEELDRLAREKDEVLVAVKGAHVEQLRELQASVLELQAHCETLEAQLRRAEWRQADTAKEKDAAIDRLREDASTVKSAWDAQIAQLSKEMVSKDLQIQMLQEEEAKLKAQVARSQQDIERYKQQLSLAVERERSLERDQVQLGLDWQRRCDDIERDQIQKSEALIQGLTTAKSQVAAKLQETEWALREQEVVLKAVTLERDQAVKALRMHGLPGPGAQMLFGQHEEEISKDFPSSEIQRLREQNTSLRSAIAQMRKEMEALSHQIPPPAQTAAESTGANQPDPKAGGDTATPDYVLALEAEIRTLKHKFKTLEEHLDVLDPLKMSSPRAESQPSVRSSTETTDLSGQKPLFSAGGSVHAGPVSSGLALRKLGDRVQLLNLLVTRLRQKVLREPLEPAAFQRELPREVDQVHLEVLELRKQVAELGKHLRTAHHGGGEPSGKKRPPASDAVTLGREGLAKGEPVEAEDEGELFLHLRPVARAPQTLSMHQLQRKLKEAARKILSLCLEKEQLIEMGNRLRAELGRPEGRPLHHALPPAPEARKPGEEPRRPLDRSPPLGQVQPHVTAQDAKSAEDECPSGPLGKHQPRPAQVGSRFDALRGPKTQRSIHTVTCKSPRQKEDRSPKPPQAPKRPEEHGRQSHSSSSLASGALQDTWRLLDLGSSPSGLTSQGDSTPVLEVWWTPVGPRLGMEWLWVSASQLPHLASEKTEHGTAIPEHQPPLTQSLWPCRGCQPLHSGASGRPGHTASIPCLVSCAFELRLFWAFPERMVELQSGISV
nr:coiled-coil domain-containing protein 57 isoform X2 [Chlorocebus sabaeus]XP_037849341.1 coiled-coil domain-containing protein 57 isoform X2 [Chlorocebus sabaeus]XP_037849342.1 coiled-coil domain-containing protein 57 isoform X2 [Chlorocebus sabaeus]XP_037849343.1 coiled-coil domain-containing protein 57 isoform X2 [Chlorocebus sabaeus]XP_037849344.1 coiled-coil domain-containing protein 57 isoform X2 [Chlorocebus sabaeus]XP_037849346.1 coiled-coil domain-containing protein 57 isoform X2 [Ch